MDIGGWLRSLGLEQYEATFRANAIEADVPQDLTDQDLEKLGVLLGHRRRLLRAIAELDGAPAAAITESSALLGVRPALRYARWRGQRTLYACTIPNWRSWKVMRWISSPGLYRRRLSIGAA
jgi:SAM domain (Sterile alpha motif)